MAQAEAENEATLFPKPPGERLREAREEQGLALSEIAGRTRIPLRHLEAIEQSDYSGLPSPTYAVGFAKAYARAVGADEVSIGHQVRGNAETVASARPEYQPYETNDPARLPSAGVVIVGVVVAVLLLIGIGLWFGTSLFQGSGNVASAPAQTAAVAPPPQVAPVQAPVVSTVRLTATDQVWLRVYAGGKTLYEATLQPGDHYDVPAGADRPMINVGRPDKLTITVDGSEVAPLGAGDHAIKDAGISAAALLARNKPASAQTAANGAAPAATKQPAPATQPARAAPAKTAPAPQPEKRATRPKPKPAEGAAPLIDLTTKPPPRPSGRSQG